MSGKRISLVLGSGGARGLAHIGVIEVLEEQGFEIASISGCSMGALIGGVHAMGKLAAYKDWVCALDQGDVLRLLDFSFSSAGLIKGDRVMDAMRELVGDCDIEDLPIDFTAVATDLDARREVWIDDGSLFEAIRASIAVPTVFAPARRGGRTLVDGGLLNPVPIAPTLRDDTDLTIAVDLAGHRDPELDGRGGKATESDDGKSELDEYRQAISDFIDRLTRKVTDGVTKADEGKLNMLDVVNRSFDAMQVTLSRIRLAEYQPDVLIAIPRNVCQTFEYYRAAEVIAEGRRQTERTLEREARVLKEA
jgi:NTE family protein